MPASDVPQSAKRAKIGFLAPAIIVLVLALTAAGTYYVRAKIQERRMILALEIGDDAAIEALVKSWPCPTNACDNQRVTPLHWASMKGRVDLARRLLSRGADVNARDKSGKTPLALASPKDQDTADVLRQAGGK